MKIDLKIPSMGESVSEASIAAIIKPNGSMVVIDEEIIEIETDKVNQVLFAPETGKLTLTVKEEDNVLIGDVIGYVDTEAKGAIQAPKPTATTEEPEKTEPTPLPSSNKLARHSKEMFIEEIKTPTPTPQTPTTTITPKEETNHAPKETRKKMSKMRQTIAKHLLDAKNNTAMLTTFNEIDMSTIMTLRKSIQEEFVAKHGIKLGFMSLFLKASVAALEAIPHINASIEGDEIIQRHTQDIGIAVSTERGLVVPVVRNCKSLSFAQVETQIATYAKKAREGGLIIDDLKGGGFTITNGGVFGSLLSTPILNPPQSGILGMHTIQQRPIAVDGQVVIRPMMYVALSYDHRVVDGKEAVTFLVHIKNSIENPHRLLFDL